MTQSRKKDKLRTKKDKNNIIMNMFIQANGYGKFYDRCTEKFMKGRNVASPESDLEFNTQGQEEMNLMMPSCKMCYSCDEYITKRRDRRTNVQAISECIL